MTTHDAAVNLNEDHGHHGGHHGHGFDPKEFYKPYIAREPTMWNSIVDAPVRWFHDNVVMRLRGPPYPYYHMRFSRVTPIDQCFTEDWVCFAEANTEFKRDRKVEGAIIKLLRRRKVDCYQFYNHQWNDIAENCKKATEDYEEAVTNYFIKYGEIGYTGTVRDAYMKQKHRLLWERRHGPIGGDVRKAEEAVAKDENMVTQIRQKFTERALPKQGTP